MHLTFGQMHVQHAFGLKTKCMLGVCIWSKDQMHTQRKCTLPKGSVHLRLKHVHLTKGQMHMQGVCISPKGLMHTQRTCICPLGQMHVRL